MSCLPPLSWKKPIAVLCPLRKGCNEEIVLVQLGEDGDSHLKIHNGEKSSKCNQSHHGSCLRGHLKQTHKPKICQLRTHSLSQQGNSYLKHSGEKSLVQSLQCIYKDAVTVNSPSLVTHLKVHSGDKAMRRWFLCKLVKWR